MFSPTVTYRDRLVADFSEIDLEERLFVWKRERRILESRGEKQCKDRQRESNEIIMALHQIDDLIAKGTYGKERQRLRNEVAIACKEAETSVRSKLKFAPPEADLDVLAEWTNFSKGLHSKDPEIRKIFQDAFEQLEMGDKAIFECMTIMKLARRIDDPKQRGRPPATPPWRNEVDALDAMRLHVFDEMTIPRAAKIVADAEGKTNAASRAERFEKLYRDRMKLRDLKSV